jgi:hypothetical protein
MPDPNYPNAEPEPALQRPELIASPPSGVTQHVSHQEFRPGEPGRGEPTCPPTEPPDATQ